MQISELEDKLNKAKIETNDLKAKFEAANTSLNNLELKNSELVLQISTMDSQKRELELNEKELVNQIQESRNENERLKTELADHCEKHKLEKTDMEIQCDTITDQLSLIKNAQTEIKQLGVENESLKSELLEKCARIAELGNKESGEADTKVLMNMVYSKLCIEFNAEEKYSGMEIKKVLAGVIRVSCYQNTL